MWTLFLLPLVAVNFGSEIREPLWLNCINMQSRDKPIELNKFDSISLGHVSILRDNMSTFVLDLGICCNVTESSFQSCRSCDNGIVECDLLSHENLTLNLETCNITSKDRIWCEQRSLQSTVSISPTASQPAETSFLLSATTYSQTTITTSTSFSTVLDTSSTPASISTPALTSSLPSSSTPASTSAFASRLTFASTPAFASTSSEALIHENSTDPTSIKSTPVSSTENSTNINVETSTAPAQESHSLKNLYTFLIVAGVLFVLVILLVCFFFCRKKREKASISHVDYPLEYWHDREYIEGVVEKSYCPTSSSLVINPVYENGKGDQAATAPTQRYRKKEDSLDRRSNQQRKPSDHLKRSNANRQRSNGSSEGPRKARRDHAENYVATAAGSNFYQYDQPARAEPRTNLDDDSTYNEVDLGNPGPANIPGNGGTSSFRPASREGRRKRRAPRGPGSRHSDWESEGERADHEVYAISYKNRLQKNLDDWSAEESDV